MSFGVKPEWQGGVEGPAKGTCPDCGVELDAGTTPPNSIVICARCCATLFWDGSFAAVTDEQLECLSDRDRLKLDVLVAAQRARIEPHTNN